MIFNFLIYSRVYAFELCNASIDKLFLKEGDKEKYEGPIPPIEDILLQLANGLEYIHEKNLVHRDLRPENALIWVERDQGKNKVVMKWSDFGLSKPTRKHESRLKWLAPEILMETQYNTHEIQMCNDGKTQEQLGGAQKSDVFSGGLIFSYILLRGEHPYGIDDYSIHNNLKNDKPVHLHSNFMRIIYLV